MICCHKIVFIAPLSASKRLLDAVEDPLSPVASHLTLNSLNKCFNIVIVIQTDPNFTIRSLGE